MRIAASTHLQRLRAWRGVGGGVRWVWAALVLAVLWAPTLGALHRQLHAHLRPEVATQSAPNPLHAALSTLFGHRGDSADCQLFDQCASGDALVSVPVLALPLAPPLHLAVLVALEAPVRIPAFYDARGPPRAR